jgi:hypothetical protein
MALSHSTGLKNYNLTSGFKTAFDGGKIDIYSGTRPTNADTVLSGNTLLGTLTLNATAFGAASGGVLTAAAITSDTSADATGTATWFRMYVVGENPATASTTLKRLDGSVGTSGTDMILDNTSISLGGTIALTALSYTHPA